MKDERHVLQDKKRWISGSMNRTRQMILLLLTYSVLCVVAASSVKRRVLGNGTGEDRSILNILNRHRAQRPQRTPEKGAAGENDGAETSLGSSPPSQTFQTTAKFPPSVTAAFRKALASRLQKVGSGAAATTPESSFDHDKTEESEPEETLLPGPNSRLDDFPGNNNRNLPAVPDRIMQWRNHQWKPRRSSMELETSNKAEDPHDAEGARSSHARLREASKMLKAAHDTKNLMRRLGAAMSKIRERREHVPGHSPKMARTENVGIDLERQNALSTNTGAERVDGPQAITRKYDNSPNRENRDSGPTQDPLYPSEISRATSELRDPSAMNKRDLRPAETSESNQSLGHRIMERIIENSREDSVEREPGVDSGSGEQPMKIRNTISLEYQVLQKYNVIVEYDEIGVSGFYPEARSGHAATPRIRYTEHMSSKLENKAPCNCDGPEGFNGANYEDWEDFYGLAALNVPPYARRESKVGSKALEGSWRKSGGSAGSSRYHGITENPSYAGPGEGGIPTVPTTPSGRLPAQTGPAAVSTLQHHPYSPSIYDGSPARVLPHTATATSVSPDYNGGQNEHQISLDRKTGGGPPPPSIKIHQYQVIRNLADPRQHPIAAHVSSNPMQDNITKRPLRINQMMSPLGLETRPTDRAPGIVGGSAAAGSWDPKVMTLLSNFGTYALDSTNLKHNCPKESRHYCLEERRIHCSTFGMRIDLRFANNFMGKVYVYNEPNCILFTSSATEDDISSLQLFVPRDFCPRYGGHGIMQDRRQRDRIRDRKLRRRQKAKLWKEYLLYVQFNPDGFSAEDVTFIASCDSES